MSTLFARPTIGAEPGQIVATERFPFVFLATARAERAEALVIVRARVEAGVRFQVQVQALLSIWTELVLAEEVAFRHSAPVNIEHQSV